MKVALVHDYLREFGGAERVLKVLAEMYPEAPIYTAFSVKGSTAESEFRGCEIHESWLAPLLKIGKLYSPLRFLSPLIWGTMDLTSYDLVIVSCSWYITRGFKVDKKTKVVAYCHTPPRWLYGYETSINLQKYWPVRVYAAIVGHFMRIYDFSTAQKPKRNVKLKTQNSKPIRGVDYFIANSENVKKRIGKFYRRDSVVIYPPVEVEKIKQVTSHQSQVTSKHKKYFLIASRLVGAKGIESAIKAFQSDTLSGYKIKIVGEKYGYSTIYSQVTSHQSPNIEFLGRVSDEELWQLYAHAQGFLALARDEDFGMTVVEAQAAGTPVIAFNGGGFRESIVDGETGILINGTDEQTIISAVKKLNKTIWNRVRLQKNAERFSKERFIMNFRKYISDITNK
jgi:glycosyltransferase involved in cell wall biosynthesis